jgi:D-alanyl-D-alanine dipeptidase
MGLQEQIMTDQSNLRACILSGQASHAQAVAHHQAGEMDIGYEAPIHDSYQPRDQEMVIQFDEAEPEFLADLPSAIVLVAVCAVVALAFIAAIT